MTYVRISYVFLKVFLPFTSESLALVLTGNIQRSDMIIMIEAFMARAKKDLQIEFDIIKETENIVDLKPRRGLKSSSDLVPCISFVLHSRFHNIEALLAQADISVCQVAMTITATHEGITKVFVAKENVRDDIRQNTMECLVDLTKTSRNILASRQRILKYVHHSY